MERVAIICCYNNDEIFDSMLKCSIEKQEGVIVEQFFYNNQFSSAAAAYNYAALETTADYLIFVHQDIKFLKCDALLRIVDYISQNKDGVYGLCGAIWKGQRSEVYSNVYHGLQNKKVGMEAIDLVEVDGLDEIFIAFHRSLYEKIQFDEINFDGWHLFVHDYCIHAKLCGKQIFVMPIEVQHKNVLEMPKYMMVYNLYPKEYYFYLKRLWKKYYKEVEKLVSPCFAVETKWYIFWRKVKLHECRTGLLRYLRKKTFI